MIFINIFEIFLTILLLMVMADRNKRLSGDTKEKYVFNFFY